MVASSPLPPQSRHLSFTGRGLPGAGVASLFLKPAEDKIFNNGTNPKQVEGIQSQGGIKGLRLEGVLGFGVQGLRFRISARSYHLALSERV